MGRIAPPGRIRFQGTLDRIAGGAHKSKPARVFRFEEIAEAHRLMESNEANRKIVVRF
jgi:NADPH2:quinone reductase